MLNLSSIRAVRQESAASRRLYLRIQGRKRSYPIVSSFNNYTTITPIQLLTSGNNTRIPQHPILPTSKLEQLEYRICPDGSCRFFSAEATSAAGNPSSITAHSPDGQQRWAQHCQVELDFFGEPVTFLVSSSSYDATSRKVISNAMAALDGCLLAVVSKGLSCTDGGDEGGLEVRSAHAAAVSWAELLRYAAVWNSTILPDGNEKVNSENHLFCPILAVVAVAPVLIQAGSAYVKHLDGLLKHTKPAAPGLPPVQMYDIALTSATYKDDKKLNPRERLHLRALHYLLHDEYRIALSIYLKILQSCPGDALALILLMDLSQTLGDKDSALRAAGSVASYWNERRGGIITPAITGYSLVSSLVALGLAVGGKVEEAEIMADRAMNKGKKICGGLATWAQCHIFDAKGRVAEGISALANFDGIRNYEGSGFLFFDCRLGGYGARFSLDREERGRGKSASLRLYEDNFERVLGYSGFGHGQPWQKPLQRAPLSWREPSKMLDSGNDSSKSSPTFLDKILGRNKEETKKPDFELILQQVNYPTTQLDGWEPSAEDVLTWLPPTPQFLSDATLLCLRFTLNGTISNRNTRWDNVRNAWSVMLDIQREREGDSHRLAFCPLASIVASLLFPPHETGGDSIGTGRLAEGLFRMGELLKLGNPETDEQSERAVREFVAERSPNFWLPSGETERTEWKKVVTDIYSAIGGYELDSDAVDDEENNLLIQRSDPSLRFQAWDFEARPILEHAVVYAACKAGDIESLCIARSICSTGVTTRFNSPEEWWRYSIVLGLLGDDVASEDALNASINIGGGQGARGTFGR